MRYLLMLILVFSVFSLYSQESSVDNWDNELWTGMRFAWGKEKKIKYTVEYQSRFIDSYKNLDRWYVEGALHYIAWSHFEIISDFRYNIRPVNNEYRIGAGIIYKNTMKRFMFVNQLKGQMDKADNRNETWAVRDVVYLNFLLNDKLVPYVGGGVFFRHSDIFDGLQILRGGAGIYYNFNPLHVLSINYFVGRLNLGDYNTYSGILFLQLTLKFNNDYIYMPAKYVNF